MSITKERLNFAGWLSITSAVLTVIFLATILKAVEGSQDTKILFTLISMGLFVYIFSSLKKLLNFRFKFHEVDTYISVLIWGNVALSIFSILSSGPGEEQTALSNLLVIASVIFEILFIVFAIRMLRLSDNLFGLLKPFSYTTIASGICIASIIFIPLGLIASAASDVILGMIFFRAAEQTS